MSDGCGTYAHWTLHVWVPDEPLKRALNELRDVEASVVAPVGDLPADAGQVEFVVAPFDAVRVTEIIEANSKLRVVQAMSAGVDFLDGVEIPDAVRLCDARGVHDTSTAEWVLAGILADYRELPRYVHAQRSGTWAPAAQPAREVRGSRVLIVGYGAIGNAVEERLRPFGASVTRVARTARDGVHAIDDLPRLVPEADIVVVTVPLTGETRGLVDKDFLGLMRDGALLVNAARGPVADTQALLAELEDRRLRAVLDVSDPEPLPADHPLWSAPGLLLTPHVGGSTTGMRDRLIRLVCEQVERYRDGHSLVNVVTAGY